MYIYMLHIVIYDIGSMYIYIYTPYKYKVDIFLYKTSYPLRLGAHENHSQVVSRTPSARPGFNVTRQSRLSLESGPSAGPTRSQASMRCIEWRWPWNRRSD